MSAPKGGEPAFPRTNSSVDDRDFQDGMSLLDWFAGQALAGLLASSAEKLGWAPSDAGSQAWVAETAYRFADAMLVERERRAK